MLIKLLLVLAFGISPFSSGYENSAPSQYTKNQPTEMEQAINNVSEADELVLQFKEKTGEAVTESTSQDLWINTELSGDYLTKAEMKTDEFSQNFISLTFTDEGADLLAEITEKNIGKQLGIFINGELISAPIVNDRITGGEVIITGNFTPQETEDLAEALNRTIKSKK